VTSQMMAPVIAEFLEKNRGRVNLYLQLRTEMNFERVILDLQMGEVDLAITWGLKQRVNIDYPGILQSHFGPEFDVVLISHDEEHIRSLKLHEETNQPLAALASQRVVTMSQMDQPNMELLPRPDPMRGGERIEVGTIDAVISCVRAGIGDYGLIPAIYSELDRHRQVGQLYYSEPLGEKLKLAYFVRRPGWKQLPVVAFSFFQMVQSYLFEYCNQPAWSLHTPFTKFPREPSFYTRMKYGYYVDSDRVGRGPPQWKWEKIGLTEDDPTWDEQTKFKGLIQNSYGDEFVIQEAQLFREMFYVRASKSSSSSSQSVNEFISVFTCCSEEEEWMFGSWSGRDPDNQPAIYVTLWSSRRLELRDVCDLARRATIRSILAATSAVDFHSQPNE